MTALGQITGETAVQAAQPRAEGSADFVVRHDGLRTRLADFRQQGSLKMLWPRNGGPGAPMEAVVLNTAGGLTGGDRMTLTAEAGPGARMVVTTQAAERVYRAQTGSEARVETRLAVAPGGRIDWLPQETILYHAAALRRRLRVDLAGDAAICAVESILIGRRAMGERVSHLSFRDRWDIRRDGVPIFADALRIDGDAEAAFDRGAVGGGARAVASVVLAGPQAEAMLSGLRALLPVTAGASLVREGVLFARILGGDGFALRQTLVPVIKYLTGRPVPKVWRL